MGPGEEGRQIVCCREREGFNKTLRSLGTDEPGRRPPSKACCGLWVFLIFLASPTSRDEVHRLRQPRLRG